MKRILWGLLALFAAVSCIPLEDNFPPFIEVDPSTPDFSVTPVYYQDSVVMQVYYRDNSRLRRWQLDVHRLEVADLEADWVFSQARRFDEFVRASFTTVRLDIPSRFNNRYISTGDYELRLTLFDADSNYSTFVDTFTIAGDNRLPAFLDLETSMSAALPGGAPAGATHLACPNQPLRFFGRAADNTKLRRVGYAYGTAGDASFPVRTDRYEYDTVSVDAYFNDSLQIVLPPSLNGTLVPVSIFAEDVFLNRYDTTFMVYVDCDVEPPTIAYASTSKPVVNGVAQVVEGTDFVVEGLEVSDNVELRRLEVYFYDLSGGAQLLQVHDFEPGTQTELFEPLVIPAESLLLGHAYRLKFVAYDASTVLLPQGNSSELAMELQVVEDAPPAIASMTFVVNAGTEGEQEFVAVQPGQTISLPGLLEGDFANLLLADGKGEDDVAVVRLVMRWRTPSGSVSNLVAVNLDPPAPALKFTDFYDAASTFRFLEAGTYRLQIIMTDTRGQQNGAENPAEERTYYFEVD
jgi:hypothetical protein